MSAAWQERKSSTFKLIKSKNITKSRLEGTEQFCVEELIQ